MSGPALCHLAEHAPDLAPQPIRRCRTAGRPVVVMSRLAGDPLRGRLTGAQRTAYAIALRRLFAVPAPRDLPERANGPVALAGSIAVDLAAERDWSLCQDPALVRAAATAAGAWLAHHPVPQEWIHDRVVALGDGNLDNALWDGAVCRLVDWEEFGASDLAYEVADVVEHASARLERRLDADDLLRRLCLTEPQRRRLEQHRRLFAAFWLSRLLPGQGGWSRNPAGSTEDQARHVLGLLGPPGMPGC